MRFTILAVLIALCGCATTYTGALSEVRLDANPAAPVTGMVARISVDGREVCTATGAQSTLDVGADVARKVCEAHPAHCAWRP